MKKDPKRKFLFDLVKPYKHVAAFIVALSVLGSCFDGVSIGLLVPLLINLQKMGAAQNLPRVFKWLVALLQPYSLPRQILFSLGVILFAILLKNLFMALSMRLGHWLSAKLLTDLRMRVITLLVNVGIEFHHKSRAANLIDKIMNNTSPVEALLRVFFEFFANVLTLIMLVAMLFVLSWPLSFLTLILGAIFWRVMVQYTKNVRRMSREVTAADRNVLSVVHEALGGVQLIKSYSKEQEQIQALHQKIEANRQLTYRRNFKNFSVNPLTEVMGSFAIAILFVVAMLAYKMDTQLMLTQLLPFIYILLRIVPLAKTLSVQRTDMISKWPHVELVHDLLRVDDKPFIADGHKIFPSLEREIEFRAVSFAYQSRPKPVLHDLNFFIPAGKTTAIVGESGAGKSTLANLLLRFYDPQQGEILLDGKPLPGFQLASYHRKISIVSQDTFLFSNTVKFNIAFSAAGTTSDEQIIAAAKKAGAHEFIMELPDGYETFVGDRGVRLSGGQRQRISIARAILRDPEILILDEATSALDAKTERRIHQAILELSEGRTVIIIAHRLSTIKNADQIIVLKNGQIAEIGGAEQLFGQKGEYYQMACAG